MLTRSFPAEHVTLRNEEPVLCLSIGAAEPGFLDGEHGCSLCCVTTQTKNGKACQCAVSSAADHDE